MKLKTAATLPAEWSRGYMESLFKKIDDQVNNLTDGKVNAVTNSYTAAPTSGTHAKGDFVRNTNTIENGTAPNNYVILGWICTAGGTPGTFTEVRADASGAISVGGPGSSTDNAIARWDGTGGNTIQNSVVTVSDTGVVAGASISLGSNTLTGTSLQLKTAISDETGSGALVFADTPTLVTPVLGVAAATSINKVAITAPATSATLTIADGQTLTVNGSATITNGTHSGTNTGDVTLAGTPDYITISGQVITRTKLDLADDLNTFTVAQLNTAISDGNIQVEDATLTALAAYNTNGLLTQTAADTFAGRTITGTANQITVGDGNGVAGNPTLSLPSDVIIPTVLTVPNTGLHILDTNATHDLIIAPGSNLTADRTLTITTGDADRTLTIDASATLNGGTHSGTNTGDQTDITGNAGTVTVANEATDTTCFPLFGTAATGNLEPKTNANMTFNSNTGVVTFASSVLTTTDINGGTIDNVSEVVVGHTARLTVVGVPVEQVLGTTTDGAARMNAMFSSDANGPVMYVAKSRNAAIGSHTAVQASDNIGGDAAVASDGAAWVTCGNMLWTVDAAVSSGIVPSRLTVRTMNTSGVLTTGMIFDSGQVQSLKQGGSTGFYIPSGAVHINTTAIGNVGAGEDNLRQYSLPTSAFNAAAKMIRWTAHGTTANNANAKTLKFYFGTALLATITLTTSQANTWKWVAHIISTGTDTQDYNYEFFQDGTTEQHTLGNGTATEDDGAAIVVKPTAEAVNTNDVVQEFQLVEFFNGV